MAEGAGDGAGAVGRGGGYFSPVPAPCMRMPANRPTRTGCVSLSHIFISGEAIYDTQIIIKRISRSNPLSVSKLDVNPNFIVVTAMLRKTYFIISRTCSPRAAPVSVFLPSFGQKQNGAEEEEEREEDENMTKMGGNKMDRLRMSRRLSDNFSPQMRGFGWRSENRVGNFLN